MLTVLHVSATGEHGGVETVVLNILRSLDRSRFTPEVLLLENGPFVKEVQNTGTPVHVIESGRVRNLLRGRVSVARTVDLIRSRGVNLVHCHNAKAHLYGGLAASSAGIPHLYHLHGVPRLALDRDGVINVVSLGIGGERTVACSEYVADAFRRTWKSRRQIEVVHNGTMPCTTCEQNTRDLRTELGIPSSSNLIVAVTRLQRWKGVHVLVEAAARVIQRRDDVCFLVVGGTLFGLEKNYSLELERQARSLRLGNALRFVGHQTDVYRYLLAADIVVHSPIAPEPFGMVLVEAMACAKPVVATDTGGPREIIEDRVTGFLVAPNDVGSLAQALESLVGDPVGRVRMGQAGAARVRERFSSAGMARRFETIYEEMAGKGDCE